MANHNQKPKIASEQVAEKFQAKMKGMEQARIEKETEARARQTGIGYINLVHYPIIQETLAMVSEAIARADGILPFLRTEKELNIAIVNFPNPRADQLKNELESRTGLQVKFYLTSENSFNEVLKQYSLLPKRKPTPKGVTISGDQFLQFQKEIKNFRELSEKVSRVSMSDLLVLVLAASVQCRASDIHFEAGEDKYIIRFRIDGILYEAASLAGELGGKIITRIKLLAKLKINITAKPQDGRFTIYLPREAIDVRVSTMPSREGETAVLRLLRSSAAGLDFKDLGIEGKLLLEINKEISRPQGMILSCGPTGSGKTTTLYAILNKIKKPDIKIITIEDPIEYKLEGITQTQINEKLNLGFAEILKSTLRQDPDVLMVGEIRNKETAQTAIDAALTGHLVISTLHTNSASATVPRLLSLEVKANLVSPALNAIIAQRLVRRICPACKKETKPDAETLTKIKKILAGLPKSQKMSKILKFYQGKGCDKCQGIGYHGRVGIFEILLVREKIKEIILEEKITEFQIAKLAKEQGMITMVQDGLLKALQGITSVDEVFRVIE